MQLPPLLIQDAPRFPQNCGLLLVGHGSREAVGVNEFLETARWIAAAVPETPVEPCFLEFAEPRIADCFERLVARGASTILVVPVLLFAAGHAKQDIPAEVAAAAQAHPQVRVLQADHLGCHPQVIELSHERFLEAGGPPSQPLAAGELPRLVLVGRGSTDPEAIAETRRFAALRAERAGLPKAEVGFVAMAAPPLNEVLETLAAEAPGRIVVQPHLLFGGVLLDRIAGIVQDFSGRYPAICWQLAGHLGPDPRVARALLERASQTLSPGSPQRV